MTIDITRLNIQTTQSTLAKGVPFSADLFNDFSESASTDFASLALQWNNALVPLMSLMPDGTQDTLVNAYATGADGSTIYVLSSADTSALNIRYYNTNRQRPKTIKEMLDDLYGNVAIAGVKGEKGDPGPTGAPGANGAGGGPDGFTFTAFGHVTDIITNTTASVPTVNAEFFVDFSRLASTIDIYFSVIAKINAAAYAGGIAVWASTETSDAAGPTPYSALGDTLLALIEFPTLGTGGVYQGYDDVVLNFANPGGKKFITFTSFAGATTPMSDSGSIQLQFRGLTFQMKDHT